MCANNSSCLIGARTSETLQLSSPLDVRTLPVHSCLPGRLCNLARLSLHAHPSPEGNFCTRKGMNNLPLKTPRIGEVFTFYKHIAHATQKVENSFVFLRGKGTNNERPSYGLRRPEEGDVWPEDRQTDPVNPGSKAMIAM